MPRFAAAAAGRWREALSRVARIRDWAGAVTRLRRARRAGGQYAVAAQRRGEPFYAVVAQRRGEPLLVARRRAAERGRVMSAEPTSKTASLGESHVLPQGGARQNRN